MERSILTYTCDICGVEEAEGKDGANSFKNWVGFERENPHEERSFTKYHVCPACVIRILHVAQVAKMAGQANKICPLPPHKASN